MVHPASEPPLLRGLTVDEAARRYVPAMVRACQTERWPDLRSAYGEDDWICDGFYDGGFLWDEGRLPFDVWFDMIVAAADHALALGPSDQHSVLFGLGDGCSDHLVGEDCRFMVRFHEARRHHAGVEAMFQVMQEDAAGTPWEHTTWWCDGYPEQAGPSQLET